MSSTVEPASVSDQFAIYANLLVSNGWANQPQLDDIRKSILEKKQHKLLSDKRAIERFLVELQILNNDQVEDLDAALQQQVNFSKYHLLRRLGAGGMGTVFFAEDIESNRIVAIKTMMDRLKADTDFVERFHRESKVLSGIRHKNVAEVYESGESGNACFMAMEYVNGPNLADLLKENKVLPEVYVLHVMRQVAEGLGYVYEKAKLVHRDIKPENILLSRDPNVKEDFPLSDVAKLIDFGLVKPVSDELHLTQTGMTIGTPLYMSPEQIRGEHIDCRSDIYGIGATMYHLLTGQTPFSGTSPGSIMSAHLTQPVPDPSQRVPGLNAKTRELVIMAMAKKPENRFTSFGGLINAIEAALTDLGEKTVSSPKLLRKPLVIKGPKTKVSSVNEGPFDEDILDDESGGFATSDRIARKYKESKGNNGAGQDGTKAGIVRAISGKKKAETTTRAKKLQLGTERLKKRNPNQSAVFEEDPEISGGTGILPWVILAVAIAALALYFLI